MIDINRNDFNKWVQGNRKPLFRSSDRCPIKEYLNYVDIPALGVTFIDMSGRQPVARMGTGWDDLGLETLPNWTVEVMAVFDSAGPWHTAVSADELRAMFGLEATLDPAFLSFRESLAEEPSHAPV